MLIPVEIMLRGNNRVFTDTIEHPIDAAHWTDADAATILKAILVAISRAQNPGAADAPEVVLRGVNWIVHPGEGGVVIAMEIYSASAVAGPLPIAQRVLEGLITRALAGSTRASVAH
jgi:hypothetical protein